MLSDSKGQIGIVSLESSGIEMTDLITVIKQEYLKK